MPALRIFSKASRIPAERTSRGSLSELVADEPRLDVATTVSRALEAKGFRQIWATDSALFLPQRLDIPGGGKPDRRARALNDLGAIYQELGDEEGQQTMTNRLYIVSTRRTPS